MAPISRPSRKLKDESNSSKNRNGGKLKDTNELSNAGSSTKGTYGLRRSVREIPSKKQRSSSPVRTRKSERLENQTPSSLVKRKSDRVEKKRKRNLPSRIERGDKHHSLSSSSKKSGKSSSSSVTKKKNVNKEKNGKQVALDIEERRKHEKLGQKLADVIIKNKKRLDARSYRALLKPLAEKVTQPDPCEKRKKQEKASKGDSANERTDDSKEVDGVADDCSGKMGEELRGKKLRKKTKEAVESCSSVSKQHFDGISINDNGNIKTTRVNRKRKFCVVEDRPSKCKDRNSKYSDTILQSSSSDLIADGTLDDAARGQVDCLVGKDFPEPVNDDDKVSTGKDLQEPVTDGDKVSAREDLSPTPECVLSTSELWPPLSDVILETDGTVGALKDSDKISIKKNLPPTSDCILSTSEPWPPSSDVILEWDGTVGSLNRKMNAPNWNPDLYATASKSCVLETSSVEAISSPVSGSFNSKLENGCFACCDRKRLDGDSYQEVCTCNTTNNDLSEISLSKEVSEKIAPLRTPQKEKIACSSFQDDPIEEKLDGDAIEQSAVAQKSSVIDLTDSPTADEISVNPKEDRGRLKVGDGVSIVEGCCGTEQKESSLDALKDDDHNACAICKLGGKLLCCDGKGCRKSYHLSCLDPPLKDAPFGVWQCLSCVSKKIKSGVHSVSEGVESLWDTREVKILDHEGMRKEKQYLVKYRGLAHSHNRWIVESQLLHEAPILLDKFNRRSQKGKIARWKSEWTVPQRLVRKRLLMTPKQGDEYLSECGTDTSDCRYEWLVKWTGLGYEHATWELENASFLRSPEAVKLIKDYENRLEKAKNAYVSSRVHKAVQDRKASLKELPNLPSGYPSGLSQDHLSFVNKLCEYWSRCQNAIVIDDQERIMKVILFIISLQSDVCRPFLIISTSTTIPIWEAELLRIAPSVNSVIYAGNKVLRKSIRELEFYEESGHAMFQVLVSPLDAIVEDFGALKSLGWEAVIVDDCQHFRVSKHYEQICMLISDFRLLLATGPIRENIHEYLNLLSFIEFGDSVHANSLKTDSNDSTAALPVLKERLAPYIAHERKSDSTKFVEYWVPVWLSNVQLEMYCATLLSNSISLYSCSKNDPVGALREILISTRKCCDHPYLVDASLQSTLTKGHPEVEYLNIGVNASGKLKLLDKILQEIKKHGLRALILFQQSIGGSGRYSLGDFLDDFVRQRFGPDSYERIDGGLVMSKKQAALNMFNNKERGRFVFLIEKSACLPSIKLTAVDAVILFDSDWNPLNDLRALQRISIDSQFEQLKVFRLYSPCTVEEKVLVFSNQDITLESNVQNISRSISHMLLIWGASYLFDRLDKFHGFSSPGSCAVTYSEESLLDDVVSEMLTQLPSYGIEADNMNNCSVILKVQHSETVYSRYNSLLGEQKMQPTEEELPHVFWKKLLEGRYPQWRYLSSPSPRARKKVQYLDDLPKISDAENDEARKKRRKGGNNSSNQISTNPCLEDKRKATSSDKEAKTAGATTSACGSGGSSSMLSKKTSIPCPGKNDLATGASGSQGQNPEFLPSKLVNNDHCRGSHMPKINMTESTGQKKLRGAQKTLHLLLEPEITKLCDILQLPENVKHLAVKFLEYIMNNHHVSSEPVSILQAFQISLCWTAASLLKYKLDRKESLVLAKQHLNLECKEEEAESVYLKLRMLKKSFQQRTCPLANVTELTCKEVHSCSPENEDVAQHATTMEAISSDLRDLKGEIRENSPGDILSAEVPMEQERIPECEETNRGINSRDNLNHPHHIDAGGQIPGFLDKCIKHIEKICAQRKTEILLKQQEEIGKFIQFRENEKKKLKEKQKLESDLIIRKHSDPLARSDMLKNLDVVFQKKKDEFDRRMVDFQRKMIAMQQVAMEKEKQRKARWLEEARSGQLSISFPKLPLPDTGFILENLKSREQNRLGDDIRDTILPSGSSSNLKNVNSAVLKPAGQTVLSEKSNDSPTRELRKRVENMPLGNVSQSSNRNVISSESDGMKDTVLEKLSKVDSPRVCSGSSPLQFCIELPSLAHSHTSHGQSAGTAARLTREVTEGMSTGNFTLSRESRNMNVVSSGSDGMKNALSGGNNEADKSSHPYSPSSQQVLIELPSLTASQTNPCDDNAQPTHQVPSTDRNQPILSAEVGIESMTRCGGQSSSNQIKVVSPVDVTSSQAEQSNGISSDSHSDVQLQLPQTEVHSAEYDRLASSVMGRQDEPSSAGCSSQQAEVAMEQLSETLTSQAEQHHCLTSQSSTLLPTSVYMNMRPSGIPRAGPGRSTGMIQEPSHRSPQNLITLHAQLLHAGPLQNELNKIRREEEKAIKMHEDEKIRLKSECEREVEEICRKYSGFIHDAERMFQLNLKTIQTNFNKVCKNLMLAEAFRLMLTDATKNRKTASRQGLRFSSSRQSSIQSLPQTAHRLSSAQTAAPPIQHSALSLGNMAAPHISSVVQSPISLHVGAELRAPAPHLQPFRPTISMPAAPDQLPHLIRMPSQQQPHNSLINTSSLHPHSMSPPLGICSGTNLPNETSASPSFHNPSLSALELLIDINNQSGVNLGNLPPLTEPSSTFDSLVPINPKVGSGLHATTSSHTSPSTLIDVISVSDDD